MKLAKKTKECTMTLFNSDAVRLPTLSLGEFITLLQEKAAIIENLKGNINVTSQLTYSGYTSIRISYERDETDEELAKRQEIADKKAEKDKKRADTQKKVQDEMAAKAAAHRQQKEKEEIEKALALLKEKGIIINK
jgi:septin family protein